MIGIGTPGTLAAMKILLPGSGEPGREVALEAMRLGAEVAAADRYKGAPAMRAAQKNHVISMPDGKALRDLVEQEKPEIAGRRGVGVALALGATIDEAKQKALSAAESVRVMFWRKAYARLR